jgi:hypothetical protein
VDSKGIEERKNGRKARSRSCSMFDGTDDKWKDSHDKLCAYGEYKGWWYTLKQAKSDSDTDKEKQDRNRAKYSLTMCVVGDAAESSNR